MRIGIAILVSAHGICRKLVCVLLSILAAVLPCTAAVDDIPAALNDLQVPTYVWSPNQNPPKAIVVCLHGAVLHGRSFKTLAGELAKQQILVVSLDIRGYGLWYHDCCRRRKDASVCYENTLQDIRALLQRLRSLYPGAPVICLGESLGSNLAFVVGARMPELVDGIITISPYTKLRPYITPRILLFAAQIVLNPKSELDVSAMLEDRLASEERIALEHLADPLGRNKQTIIEMLTNLSLLWRGKRAAQELPARMPVLVIVGAKDELVSIKGIFRLFDKLPCKDKELLLAHDSGHLMVETSFINPGVLQVISRWIADRSKASGNYQYSRAL